MRRTAANSELLKEKLRKHLLSGGTAKEFAIDHGIHLSWAYRMKWEAGIRAMFLLPEEREQILRARKA